VPFHAKLKEVSNQADWAMPIQIMDRSSQTLVDFTGTSFAIAVVPAAPMPDATPRSWYGYGVGSAAVLTRQPVLTGSTATGEISIFGPGVLFVYFPAARMRGLAPGMYKVGLTCTNGGQTIQLIIGYLPVRDGVVTPALTVA